MNLSNIRKIKSNEHFHENDRKNEGREANRQKKVSTQKNTKFEKNTRAKGLFKIEFAKKKEKFKNR